MGHIGKFDDRSASTLHEMITGAVLAGGTSSRFGGEKALAEFGASPMISHVIAVLEQVTDEILVAVAPGRSSVYTDVFGDDVLVVEDWRPGLGPLQGLSTALKAANGEHVLVSPCDTPLLRKEVCEVIKTRGMNGDGAVPRIGGYLEPLHAIFRRESCLKVFMQVIEKGVSRPKDAYAHLDLTIVEEEELRTVDPNLASFVNVNSEEAFSSAVSLLGRR